MLVDNETVRDHHVEKEMIYVLIKFPTLSAAAVIGSQLIAEIHTTHRPIVQNDTLRAGNRDSGAILLPPHH